MPWIELHQAVPTHHKTLALADALDVHPVTAMGHVCCLWLWAVDNAPDGRTSRFGHRTIARGSQWDGDAGQFVQALIGAGFLDADGAIHDWAEYTGRLLQQRRRKVAQVQAWRRHVTGNVAVTYRQRAGSDTPPLPPPLEPPLPDRTGPDTTTTGIMRGEADRAVPPGEGGGGGVVLRSVESGGGLPIVGHARESKATPASVAIYAISRHTTLPEASARLITDTVGDDAGALDRWRRVVEACEANGIGTRNVACALDWYANGIPPKYRVGGAPPTPPPQEVPELRQPTPEEEAAALAAKEQAREQLARRGLLRQFDQIGGPPP